MTQRKARLISWLVRRWVLDKLGPDQPPLSFTIEANEPWLKTGEREMEKKVKLSLEYCDVELINIIMTAEQFDYMLSKGMVGRLQQDVSFERVN